MFMRWEGVTPEQYDALKEAVKWDTDPAEGEIFHAASFDDKGLRVCDVWESEEDLNNFMRSRMMPGVQELGIPGQPQTEVLPLHFYVATSAIEVTEIEIAEEED